MLVRVQVRLLCPSEADANTVRDSLAQKIASKAQFTVHQAPRTVSLRGQWVVVGDVSFTARIDADDVYGDVQAKWSGGQLRNRILAGSTATLHICSHAEGEPPPWQDCTSIELQLATKG
jgi:hypothetical protein